jgi:outer membrane protein TolC
VIAWWLAGATLARADGPLTYAEALGAVAAQNGLALRADYAHESARASLRSARGLFDPMYVLEGTYERREFAEIRDGFPAAGTNRTWNAWTGLTGMTSTGTTYTLSAGAGYFREFVSTLEPLYDEDGDRIGTVPYDAESAAYESNLMVTLSQHLLRGVRMSYNLQSVRLARQAETTAELLAEQVRQQAMADAAVQYWTWVYLDRVRAIDEEAVATAAEALRVAALQVESRRLAPVERTRVESAWVASRASVLTSAALADQARDALLVSMGQRPGQAIEPATEPGDPPIVTLDREAVTARALENSVELAAARATVETQALALGVQRHGRLPILDAFVTAARTTGTQPTIQDAAAGLFGDDALSEVIVGATLMVPLGNRTASGAAEAAAYDLLAAENAVVELEQRIAAAVAYQVALLEGAHERVEAADAATRLASETLAAMETLVAAGRAVTKDVLEARTALDRARGEAIRARTDWRLAYTELARLQSNLSVALP